MTEPIISREQISTQASEAAKSWVANPTMHHPNPSTTTTETNSHVSPIPCGGAVTGCGEMGLDVVSDCRHSLTDDEREAAIKRAGIAMEKAWKDYEDGEPMALVRAHELRRLMEVLIKGRSAERVAQMEAARGLA
jgi:hypothetical protein